MRFFADGDVVQTPPPPAKDRTRALIFGTAEQGPANEVVELRGSFETVFGDPHHSFASLCAHETLQQTDRIFFSRVVPSFSLSLTLFEARSGGDPLFSFFWDPDFLEGSDVETTTIAGTPSEFEILLFDDSGQERFRREVSWDSRSPKFIKSVLQRDDRIHLYHFFPLKSPDGRLELRERSLSFSSPSTPATPWILNEDGEPLFRVHDDGAFKNDSVKLEIALNPTKGFDVTVREFEDFAHDPNVLQRYRELSLERDSDRFVQDALKDRFRVEVVSPLPPDLRPLGFGPLHSTGIPGMSANLQTTGPGPYPDSDIGFKQPHDVGFNPRKSRHVALPTPDQSAPITSPFFSNSGFVVPFQGGFDGTHPAYWDATGEDLRNTEGLFGYTSEAPVLPAYLSAFENAQRSANDFSVVVTPDVSFDLKPKLVYAAQAFSESVGALYLFDLNTADSEPRSPLSSPDFGSSFVTSYFGWVQHAERGTPVPPSSVVLPTWAKSDFDNGPWKSTHGDPIPVNVRRRREFDDVETAYQRSSVNFIKDLSLYGNRTFKDDFPIASRRALIFLSRSFESAVEPFLFDPPDEIEDPVRSAFSDILDAAAASGILSDFRNVQVQRSTRKPQQISVSAELLFAPRLEYLSVNFSVKTDTPA